MSRYLVNLKKGNDYLVPKVFGGMDTSNLLSSQTTTGNLNYTATTNCVCQLAYNQSSTGGFNIYVDGILLYLACTNRNYVCNVYTTFSGDGNVYFPLITGQTLTTTNVDGTSAKVLKVYGLKY